MLLEAREEEILVREEEILVSGRQFYIACATVENGKCT